MQIVEVFQSLQGEGLLIGLPMIFVRLWGCDMACTWCDTRYSWAPEYKNSTKREHYTPSGLAERLLSFQTHAKWVNFTGGEPTLWAAEISETVDLLPRNFQTCIQTNGRKWHEELFSKLSRICMDMKCPKSGEKSDEKLLSKLRASDEVKFTIFDQDDLRVALDIHEQNPTKAAVVFQPVILSTENFDVYLARSRWLAEEIQRRGYSDIRVLPQWHQLLWRDLRGH